MDFSPRVLNSVAYSIEGRVSTSIRPSTDFPVCQSTEPKRVAKGNWKSKPLTAGGTFPASTRPLSLVKLTVARAPPMPTDKVVGREARRFVMSGTADE